MSKEAIGTNGEILGSERYFSAIHNNSILQRLMRDASRPKYHEIVQDLAAEANGAIDEIYDDLNEGSRLIRYLPSENRDRLEKQVNGLYDICKLACHGGGRASDCIRILNEASRFHISYDLDRALSFIKSNPIFSPSDILPALKDAAEWGLTPTTVSDALKFDFLKALLQGNSDSFLREIHDTYQAKENGVTCKGNCGYEIGSRNYAEHIEMRVFGESLSFSYNASSGNADYARLLHDLLQKVADQLERDLDSAIRENDYVTDESKEALLAAVDDLDSCDIRVNSLSGKIKSLAWYVGGDPAKIRELQQKLNELHINGGTHLKEDGVLGEKTTSAFDSLIIALRQGTLDQLNAHIIERIIDVLQAYKQISTSLSPLPFASSLQLHLYALADFAVPLQKAIWTYGAKCYLPSNNLNFSASCLLHALEDFPSDLYFPPFSSVAQKILGTNCVQEIIAQLRRDAECDPFSFPKTGSFDVDYGENNRDLYYSIGAANIDYKCVLDGSDLHISFVLEDDYDYTDFKILRVDILNDINGNSYNTTSLHFNLASIANDAALLSSSSSVLHPYHIRIDFETTIHLETDLESTKSNCPVKQL